MKTLLVVVMVLMVGICEAKEVVRLEGGKIAYSQPLSDEYLAKFKDDPSNPANKPGVVLLDSLKGYEQAPKVVVKTETDLRIEKLEQEIAALKAK